MAIKQRGKKLSLYKRVPKRYQTIEPRKFIWLALNTDSVTEAEHKAGPAWEQLIAGWEAKLAGDTTDAEQRFEAARDLAEARGFRYLRVEKVAKLPPEELLDRIDAIPTRNGKPDLKEAAALLGGAKAPEITVTRALELYWELAREKAIGKSADQIRKWKNPRKKAIRALVGVIGDKEISKITGDDMLDFRAWWLDRIENEGLSPSSANKDLTHLGDVLGTVNQMKRLNLVLPLSSLSFKEGEQVPRPPFSDEWIRNKVMAPSALAGLNQGASRTGSSAFTISAAQQSSISRRASTQSTGRDCPARARRRTRSAFSCTH
jgi:hypothetical protein